MSTQSDLMACLAPLVDGRVHFAVLPLEAVNANVWPCITLPTEIITPDNTLCGASDLEDYRMQIDLYARKYGDLVTLRKLVFAAIEAAFPHAERINDITDYDNDTKLHRRIIEYGIRAE